MTTQPQIGAGYANMRLSTRPEIRRRSPVVLPQRRPSGNLLDPRFPVDRKQVESGLADFHREFPVGSTKAELQIDECALAWFRRERVRSMVPTNFDHRNASWPDPPLGARHDRRRRLRPEVIDSNARGASRQTSKRKPMTAPPGPPPTVSCLRAAAESGILTD